MNWFKRLYRRLFPARKPVVSEDVKALNKAIGEIWAPEIYYQLTRQSILLKTMEKQKQ